LTAASWRSSAPLAFTVRNAPRARSSTDPIWPTAAWDRLVARRIRGTTTSTATAFKASTARVTRRSTGSSRAISTTEAAIRKMPLTECTRPYVVTVRSSVVSEVTRDSRSPGLSRSIAPTLSRSRCEVRPLRALSTTLSAALPSR
jgi:hypothetical protein